MNHTPKAPEACVRACACDRTSLLKRSDVCIYIPYIYGIYILDFVLIYSFVLEHCLHTYGEVTVNTESTEEMFCLSQEKVCRYYAEYILRPALGKVYYFCPI